MRNKHENQQWLKLDNAAKIYPHAMTRKWAPMFRLSVTLKDPVDVAILEKAQETALRRIPTFSYRLRRGLFWNYLDRLEGAPDIQQDVGNPLMRIGLRRNKYFMFRVRYHECRIAIEIFHALTDGIGGLTFLLTMIAEYLRLKHGDKIPFSKMILDCCKEPREQEMEDSFLCYARSVGTSRRESVAYHLTGTMGQEDFLHIVTGIIPVNAIREAARARECSITAFLVSLLVLAVQDIQKSDPYNFRRQKPIKVSVPVNLRRFYPTETLRNFSSYVNIGINRNLGEHSLEEIIVQVKHAMGLKITEKSLNARFSVNVKAERNTAVRALPLLIKSPILKAVFILQGDRYYTTTLSNLGNVVLPEQMSRRIARIDMLLGAPRANAETCACISYGENMYFTFTRVIEEAYLERGFFTSLVKMGIPVKIESNQRW